MVETQRNVLVYGVDQTISDLVKMYAESVGIGVGVVGERKSFFNALRSGEYTEVLIGDFEDKTDGACWRALSAPMKCRLPVRLTTKYTHIVSDAKRKGVEVIPFGGSFIDQLSKEPGPLTQKLTDLAA